jgi:hypothetical protein
MTREQFLTLNKDEQKQAKKEAWELLKTTLTENKEATEALKMLRPGLYNIGGGGGGVARTPKYITFSDMFEKKGDTVDELNLFKEMKVGRKEANNLTKEVIKKSIVNERKWISFDAETGLYELVAIGPEAPKNWTGYVPVEIVDAGDDLI